MIFGEKGWRDISIPQAVTASSAAPIYFCPVRIEGRDYVDAGIGRPAFFDLAVAKQVDLLVMINPMARIPLPISSWAWSSPHKTSVSPARQGVLDRR